MPQQLRRTELRLQNAESTCLAHGGHKFRAGEIGSHRCGNDGGVNPKSLTRARCQNGAPHSRLSGPSPDLKRTEQLTMASQGFGLHSRHKRFDIQFVGAREVELLYPREYASQRFCEPRVKKATGFAAERRLCFDRGPWKSRVCPSKRRKFPLPASHFLRQAPPE